MAPSRHDWKIVDWDVKPQHKQTYNIYFTIDNASDLHIEVYSMLKMTSI